MSEVTGLFLKIDRILLEICNRGKFWNSENVYNHARNVANIAKNEAEERGQDAEIAWISGMLHDVGSILYGQENHHKTGAEEASRILRQLGYQGEKIALVSGCILKHRSSIKLESERTELEECVADADALTHFEEIPNLIEASYRIADTDGVSMSVGESKRFVVGKIERDWNKLSIRMRTKRRAKRIYQNAIKEIEGFGQDGP